MADFFMVIGIAAFVAAFFRTDQPVAAGLLVGRRVDRLCARVLLASPSPIVEQLSCGRFS